MSWLDSLTPAQKLVMALAGAVLLAVLVVSSGVLGGQGTPGSDRAQYQAPDVQAPPILVHVIGAVQQPGVYRLPAGARVMDAVRAAGGFGAQAQPESVNLAAFCEDGDQICVQARPPAEPSTALAPRVAPSQPPAQAPVVQVPSSPPPVVTGAAGASLPSPVRGEGRRTPVRINYAGLEELQEIPGIGPELAKRIIYYRALHGPFRSFSELEQVEGIGPATIEEIRISATLN
ncbi:MAG: helix-hairpin-helix domain-containing protein [Armatimonadota bacterium]